MLKRKLSIITIILLVLSLVIPVASFAAPDGGTKQVIPRLGNVEYNYSYSISNQTYPTRTANGMDLSQLNLQSDINTLERYTIESLDDQIVEVQNFVPESDSNEEISIIVELQSDPIAVHEAKVLRGKKSANINQRAVIAQEQNNFKSAMAKKGKSKITREFSQVFNGFSMEIEANQVSQLLDISGVKAIYPNSLVEATPIETVYIQMDRSAPHIGAEFMWDQKITGKGIKIGVLDTGIDYFHPDLAKAYKGGYDFVDNDTDPYETTPRDHANNPTNPPEVNERGSTYWTSHGTHVAGTIGGRGASENGVKGIAPDSMIYAYRVLGPYGSGSTEGVIAGIEQAVKDGMDIINLSLGSSSNNQYSADSIALNNAMVAGVVVAVSAGNSGPNDGTLTDPATSEMAITVGNSIPPTEVPVLKTAGLSNIIGAMMEYSPKLGDLEGETLEVVYAGLGEASDFAKVDVTGKIALIQRGNISFQAKSINAQNAGAAVAIIFNNATGNFSGSLAEPGDYIPTLSLSQADGLLLKNKIDTDGNLVSELGYTTIADYMSDSSSRGPALPNYDMKPDISAPGTGILSTVPAYGKDDRNADYDNAYAAFSGTSMSAPHIAGSAALLIEKYRGTSITPFEVKALLMNTAHNMTERNGERYSFMDQGAGRVDLVNAADASAVALVVENTDAVKSGTDTQYETGSLSFGYLKAGTTTEKTIIVKDIAKKQSQFTISTNWFGDAAGELSTSKEIVQIKQNSSNLFTISLSIPEDTEEAYYEGEVVLTESSGRILRLPISVFVGEPSQIPPVTNLALNPDIFSPNGDGVYDTSRIEFDLNEPAGYISLDVHNWSGSWRGTVVEAGGLGPGSYFVATWGGTVAYVNPPQLADNVYMMVPWFGDNSPSAQPVDSAIAPFIIDRGAPVTILSNPDIDVDPVTRTGSVSGKIEQDLLIDLINAGILTNGIDELFGVAVLYEVDGEWDQVDGSIDAEGNFIVEVPLIDGVVTFEVYVYDAAGNGVKSPAHIVTLPQ